MSIQFRNIGLRNSVTGRGRSLRGICGGVLPVVLTAGLLGTSSAAAQGLDETFTDREDVVDYWQSGGAGVREAAERALLGTDEDIREFLDEAEALQYDDDYVEASRVINFGGNGVKEAGMAALQAGPAAVTKFLEEDQYREREVDNEVAVSRLINFGGPNMKAAGKAALQGTADDIAEFLEVGQFVARNRDQEHATIEQLTEQAGQAGQQAEEATKKSEEASARAVAASRASVGSAPGSPRCTASNSVPAVTRRAVTPADRAGSAHFAVTVTDRSVKAYRLSPGSRRGCRTGRTSRPQPRRPAPSPAPPYRSFCP
ncbi:ALF repeat-containing protein [Streptomyces sp. NPDC059708]|uniref:ALF repeat-containing protein n=1 Tax=Streptomyces sp. NPDC059708 TaxID=3346916 RepID=UPI00367CD0C7